MVIKGRAGFSELLSSLFSSFSAKQIEKMLFVKTEMDRSPGPVKTHLGGEFPAVMYSGRHLCEWQAGPDKYSCFCEIEVSVNIRQGVRITVKNMRDSYLPNKDLSWVTSNKVNVE